MFKIYYNYVAFANFVMMIIFTRSMLTFIIKVMHAF